MKKLFTFVCTLVLGASLSFAQTGGTGGQTGSSRRGQKGGGPPNGTLAGKSRALLPALELSAQRPLPAARTLHEAVVASSRSVRGPLSDPRH